MKKEQEKNALNEDTEEKNPYQQILDLPKDIPIPVEKGIEMAKNAILWRIQNGVF